MSRPEPRRSSQIDPSQFGGGDKCPVCEKTVYISERLELGDKAIHKTCLKCVACSMRLTVENYHTHADQFYCRQHYNEVHFGPSVPNPEVRLARPAGEALRLLDRRALAVWRACLQALVSHDARVEEDLSGAKDVTKTLKSQWEQQAEAEREGATPKRPEPRRSSQIDASQFGGGDKCPVCEKTVYIS